MRRAIVLTLAAAPMLAGVGCVQQESYDSLLQANRSLKEQTVRLTEERDAARTSLEATRSELGLARKQVTGLQGRNQELSGDVDRLAGEYQDLMGRVSTLDVGPLPPHVAIALEDLAKNYPNLLTFDARRGMLQLASDLTFALGSTELQPEAVATISSVADILNSQDALNLEVRVVGHTDNVPIGKPDTRQRHPTNVHLSVHRAIAVRDAMVQARVDATRIQVAGYGEHRPLVPNGPKGAAANRRVEIYLAAMPGTDQARPPAAVATPETISPARPDPMK
jgi:flagellar motor protein MotB